MKTLYIECNMGAAGDMLMSALLELHPNAEEFLNRLNKLGIPNVTVSKTGKCEVWHNGNAYRCKCKWRT